MALLPDSYKINIDINDDDILKIGLAVYLAIAGWFLLKGKK